MIKLNKTTEYALIALNHLTRSQGTVSAREVSEKYLLPYDITAKTLQRLKEIGWIESTSGSKGGYRLKMNPATVSFAKFLETFEGYHAIVACCMTGTGAQTCEIQSACEVRPFLSNLNAKVFHFLNSLPMNEIIDAPSMLTQVKSEVSV
ncbi:MAG: Rrf2 family transcriptional regulator [Xanthomonadaceae bacterium]|nr:Rrf2 family transcriptional regulator [Xanthomonadaceae bacterium]